MPAGATTAARPTPCSTPPLKQIDKTNVDRLKLAWFYPAPGPSGRFAFNPLVVDGVMYVVGKDNAIVALDAATGQQIWTHPVEGQPTNRGLQLTGRARTAPTAA